MGQVHITANNGPAANNGPVPFLWPAWSGFAEWARQWWLVSRRSAYRHDGKHQLYLNVGGSAGHTALLNVDVDEGVQPNRYWRADVRTHGEIKAESAEQQYEDAVQKVRAAMNGEALAKTRIRDAANIKSTIWASTFERMVEEGVLIETDQKNGRPLYNLGDSANEA